MYYITHIKQDIRYKSDKAYFLTLRDSEPNEVQMKIMGEN